MKTIITAIAASLFAASLSAADVYHGLDAGNSDLSTQRASANDFVRVPRRFVRKCTLRPIIAG
jgi:hypothetical protein